MKKKIAYIHDFCFLTDNNTVYTAVGMPEKYFSRFFEANVDSIEIISRNKNYDKKNSEHINFSCMQNKKITLPFKIKNYFSLLNPLLIYNILIKIKKYDYLVINFPSIIGIYIFLINLFTKVPYTLEIAADEDQFRQKKLGKIITPFIKFIYPRVVSRSMGGIYVSNYLLNKYPCKNSIVASNVHISNIYVRDLIIEPLQNKKPINIFFAGGVNRRKGIPQLIQAINQLVNIKKLVNIKLYIAGGHFDQNYQKMVSNFNLKKQIHFLGIIEPSEIEHFLSISDIYVQPSLAEGIPRATLEAMAYGLPIIATELPGFQEILPSSCLVPPSNSKKLADIIFEIIVNVDFHNKLLNDNRHIINNFHYNILQEKRINFYKNILEKNNEKL